MDKAWSVAARHGFVVDRRYRNREPGHRAPDNKESPHDQLKKNIRTNRNLGDLLVECGSCRGRVRARLASFLFSWVWQGLIFE